MRDRTPGRSAKQELRVEMRQVRRELTTRAELSRQIRDRLVQMGEMVRARRVLLFATIPGEPEMAAIRSWCEAHGKEAAVPEDNVDPGWPDVVIVPGLAFTVEGERLGQGGGWYDRFLSDIRPGCTTIGVGFDQQIVDSIPTESHDVALDFVVTDLRVVPAR